MSQRMIQKVCLHAAFVFACACASSASAIDIITTIAGTGTAGYTGDGGAATAATLQFPALLQKDSAGNIFFTDNSNNVVRRIDAVTGIITTVAGKGGAGFSGDGGPATQAQFNSPVGIAIDAAGNIYVADQGNNRVRKFTVGGTISTFAGTSAASFGGDGGPALSAAIQSPGTVVIDPSDGAIIISELNSSAIRRVDKTTNVITTIVGNGTNGFSGDGGLATAAVCNEPGAMCYDAAGNMFFIDGFNNRIRRVDKATKIITTFAGNGTAGFSGDGGPASAATFKFFNGSSSNGWLAIDAAGNIYVVDSYNQRIRLIDSSGKINTIAGTGNAGFNGDFIDAATADLNLPLGLLPETGGNYLLIQGGSNRISRVNRNSTATPRSITLTPGTISNNSPAGTSAGTLATTGTVPAGTTFKYSLVSGTGSTNNFQFSVSGTSLITVPITLTTTAKSLQVRVRSTDQTGAIVEVPLTVTIAGPSFTSAPSASPTSAFTQQSITFSAAAGSAAITWSFDDGSPTLTGASVTHAFNTAGTHVATATATDATGSTAASVSVQINTATPFTAAKGSVTFDFKKQNDSFSLTGNVSPPAGVDPSIFIGVTTVTVIIGQYQHDFTLNSHGQDKGTQNLFSIKGKISKTGLSGSAAVTIALKKQELFNELKSFGFVNADVKTPITVPVTALVILDTGGAFTTTANFSYTAKAGVSGKAKLK